MLFLKYLIVALLSSSLQNTSYAFSNTAFSSPRTTTVRTIARETPHRPMSTLLKLFPSPPNSPAAHAEEQVMRLDVRILSVASRMLATVLLLLPPMGAPLLRPASAAPAAPAVVAAPDVFLNAAEPRVTDTCYLDLQVEGASAAATAEEEEPPRRIELALYGDVAPATVKNFVSLSQNEGGVGYAGSSIFRVISGFSVQGGNIGNPADDLLVPSRLGRFGRAANGGAPFPAENYRISHDYVSGGVLSMMKDVANGGRQDSRFFVTLEPAASWADGKYVAFGRVSKGMEYVRQLAGLEVVPPSNYPRRKVDIVASGCLLTTPSTTATTTNAEK